MNIIIKLEEWAKLVVAYLGTQYLGFEWWLFFAWLLAPDLSMIGYAINTRVGAVLYNIAHHQGLGILMFIVGYQLTSSELIFAGCLIFGHSAMDRALGYGLKYSDDFKHTHLGWIGKVNNKMSRT